MSVWALLLVLFLSVVVIGSVAVTVHDSLELWLGKDRAGRKRGR